MVVGNKIGKIICTLFVTLLALVWLSPVFFVVMNLFKGKIEYNIGSLWAFPEGNQIVENFFKLFDGMPIFRNMLNGLLFALCGASMAVISGILAGYALSHLTVKHKLFWFLVIYIANIFPFQLYLIPIYKAYMTIGLYDTRLGMILFYSAICIPFVTFVMRNNFLSIDKEICESAKIEGAPDLLILTRLFVPMTQSAISIVFLTQFSWSWNDLLFCMTFVKSEVYQNVMPIIALMDKTNGPVVFMACLFVSLPTIAMFSLLQKKAQTGLVYTSK